MKAIEQYFQVVLFVFENFAKWNSRFFPQFWTQNSWELIRVNNQRRIDQTLKWMALTMGRCSWSRLKRDRKFVQASRLEQFSLSEAEVVILNSLENCRIAIWYNVWSRTIREWMLRQPCCLLFGKNMSRLQLKSNWKKYNNINTVKMYSISWFLSLIVFFYKFVCLFLQTLCLFMLL